jgi:ribose transport system ATP-binding protein
VIRDASRTDAAALSRHLLSVRGVEKRYPGAFALQGVDLDIHEGEVHALLGSNGAGKSTLAKVIGGVEHPDAGDVVFDGRSIVGLNPAEVAERGVAVVHQELELFPDLSVEENLAFFGRYPSWRGFVARRRMRADARAALTILGERQISPESLVSEISVAEAWLVAITSALVRRPRVLVLDESTAALAAREATILFEFLRERSREGLAVILVSHRLQEVRDVASRITVLRDGRIVDTVPADTPRVELIRLMFGQAEVAKRRAELEADEPASARPGGVATAGPALLEVTGVAAGSARDVTFALAPGEVLGIGGAVGSGRSSLAQAVAGVLPLAGGTMKLRGEPYLPRSPSDAVRRGVVLLPENRDANGVLPGMSVRQNISISVVGRLGRGPLVDRGQERAMTAAVIEDLSIKGGSEQEITTLSGGNRQKALLGRARCVGACVLVLDEPTRGLDFSARADLEDTIGGFARDGNAVIVISSEFDELARLATRVVVMRDGEMVPFELRSPGVADEGAIAQASYGGEVS